MAKPSDARKDVKKKPLKFIQEKKQAKKTNEQR
jgi:hypothetical protein